MPQVFSKISLKSVLISLVFILPVLLAYKNIIFNLPQTWGDAPYFSSDYLNEISFYPEIWSERNAPLGGINSFVFIHPIEYLLSQTHKYFNLESPLLVQIYFYLPAIVFSFLGSYLIARKFTKDNIAGLLAGLFYSTNTYILMVVDGGQAGIAAAYGLSAMTIYFGLNLDKKYLNYLFATLISLLITSVYDPRIALISLLFLFLYYLDNIKIYFKLFLITLLLAIFSSYWVYPLLAYSNQINTTSINSNLKLIHSFSLYHPNWPDNVFGITKSMPLYFPLFTLFLLSISIYFKKHIKLVLIFLIFALLSRSNLLSTLDITGAFRDTTKFYLPLMLIASILIAHIYSHFKNIYLKAFIYMFVLLLIWPALLGKLNFVLSDRKNFDISQPNTSSWYRTLFIPERYPLNYHSSQHPSLDGNYLFNLRPFAVNNAGTFDQFNYLNNVEASYLYELLGIKNIIFTPNARAVSVSEKEEESLNLVKKALSTQERLQLISENEVTIYETQNPQPEKWGVEKAVLVFGKESKEFYKNVLPVMHRAVILYPQDKYYLDKNIYDNKNLLIYSEDFNINDLIMSMIDRRYFIRLNNTNAINNWAFYSSEQFNEYQYQLLIRGIDFRGFDYGQGISFSDQIKEKVIVNDLNPNNKLFIRYYCGSGEINLDINCEEKIGFKWFEIANSEIIEITNLAGLSIVNTLVSVPNNIYEDSFGKAQNIINTNKIINNSESLALELANSNGNNFIIYNQNYNLGYPSYGILESYENSGAEQILPNNVIEIKKFYLLGLSILVISILGWGIYFIYINKYLKK